MRARSLLGDQLKGLFKQRNGALDIVPFLEVEANPTAFRQDVMRLRTASGNNLIPHLSWKRNVDEVVAMNVAQLTSAQTKLRSAKTMRVRCHTRPTQNGLMNLSARAIDCHKFVPFRFAYRMNLLRSEVILTLSVLNGAQRFEDCIRNTKWIQ